MKLPAAIAARARNEQVAILALLGVVVLGFGFLALRLLAGGGGDDLTEPIPVVSPRVPRSPTPSRTPLPVTGGAFGRDPFQPLVVPGGADGGNGGNAGNGGTPGPGGSPGPDGGATDGSGTSRRVTLVDIFRSGGELQATVSVDGTEFTVAEGERFDTSFRLLSLTSRCGTFVFGDERFTLCVGQQVRK